tara:strand:- start:120 stop:1163 length:1044 start_codon:yes stop_codon:yes gene_type:complete
MFGIPLNIIFAIATAFLITLLAIPKIIFFAKRFRLYDSAGERSAHEGEVPIFGGIAIFVGIVFSLLFWAEIEQIQFIIVSMFVVFFIGVVDDLLALSPTKKLIGQIIAILIIIYLHQLQIDNMHGVLGVFVLSEVIATLFTVFVVIVITNGFNLIDGVDGLAASLGIVASFVFGVLALFSQQIDMAILAFTLLGSLLGFLIHNNYPAKIFMGDTGSLVVGLLLSILAINVVNSGLVFDNMTLPNKGPLVAIAILSVLLFDSLRVFVVRVFRGRNPLSPDKNHIHHELLNLGFGHLKTTLIICLMNMILMLIAYFLVDMNINFAITIFAAINFILLYIPFLIKKMGDD